MIQPHTGAGERSGDTKLMWLFLLRNPGRHTGKQVSTACEPESRVPRIILQNMADRGYVKVYPKVEGWPRITFEVDKECKVPLGVTVEEILGEKQ